ncbi:hypothetical protein BH23PLA1_BH23PLA1_13820 [soil metagenome]
MRCLNCSARIEGRPACKSCGRSFPLQGGIVEAMNPLSGRNRIVADFYNGPSWRRFRKWERLFLMLQGGHRRARQQYLRHFHKAESARVLEVGIGDGDNLLYLPPRWEVHGVDIASNRLADCLERFPSQAGRLALAEAEALPFPDDTFDACLCVGGFTFFQDHETALQEMRRVTRPGGTVVVADEVPWLCQLGIGHIVGLPRIDAWWSQGLGLDRAFIDMVFQLDLDLDKVLAAALPGARRERIWAGLGYCLISD